VDFLANLYETGVSYSGLNTARSAVASIVSDPDTLSRHVLVRRFLKGAFNKRPALSKCTETWDPEIVLAHFENGEKADVMSLKDLTLKLTMLLALLSAQRVQTLVSLDINNMTSCDERVIFRIQKLMKQSRPNFHLNYIELLPYPRSERLCVVTLLKEYLKRTESLRHDSQLLVSFTQPHNAVGASTVSRWLKIQLASAGILNFTGHSTRAASTSKAFKNKIPIDSILTAAGWSGSSTFAKFYNKPIKSKNFGEALLESC
jgi:integrase